MSERVWTGTFAARIQRREALCQRGTAALARAPPTLRDETPHRNENSSRGWAAQAERVGYSKKAMLSRCPRHGISISALFHWFCHFAPPAHLLDCAFD